MSKDCQRGSVIILSLILITVTMVLITASASLVSRQQEKNIERIEYAINYYLAKAGIQKGQYLMEEIDVSESDEQWQSGDLSKGQYRFKILQSDKIVAQGDITGEFSGAELTLSTIKFEIDIVNKDGEIIMKNGEMLEEDYNFKAESQPYTVYTLAGLDQLRGQREALDKHFILGADIDASETKTWNEGAGWQPIGYDPIDPFRGVFDGADYEISGLYINRSDNLVGLFGDVEGEITNLNLSDLDISGANQVGGLAGRIRWQETTDCSVAGSISGSGYHVGGLAGTISGSIIRDVSITAEVIGGDYHVGGLAGFIEWQEIINCSVAGSISGSGYRVGGLAGTISNATIRDILITAEVTGDRRVGGIVGHFSSGEIVGSESIGRTTGNISIGGVVGFSSGISIIDSHATGEVIGTDSNIGGLIGLNRFGYNTWVDRIIKDSFATGYVKGEEQVGGLIGSNLGPLQQKVENCFATGDVEGDTMVGGLIGKNNKAIVIGSYAEGEVIGESKIGGLVGKNLLQGEIRSSYAIGDVVGTEDRVGGLVGLNDLYSKVEGSYAHGDVNGDLYVGGLVGRNHESITNSHATGNIEGVSFVGGLVGFNFMSEIRNSFTNTEVIGRDHTGGLIGRNYQAEVVNSNSQGSTAGQYYIGGLIGTDREGIIVSCDATGTVTGDDNFDDFVDQFIGYSYETTIY